MIPIRVRDPAGRVVDLADLKEHLNIGQGIDDHDLLIADLEAAAVAYLDGYRGILGRCILSQDWEMAVPCAGNWRLPLPDIVEVTASDDDGPVELTRHDDARGTTVFVPGRAKVLMTAQMPAELLPAVQAAVKMLVGYWFRFRGDEGAEADRATPLSFDAVVAQIRWSRV